MAQLHSNNAQTTLASAVTAAATTLVLAAGAGSKFAAPTGGDYQLVTICDSNQTIFEVVKVTARSGDTLTVVRGQEGFTAQAWSSGATVFASLTAGTVGQFARKDEAATIAGLWNFTTAPTIGGTAIALSGHTHTIANITGLQTALDGKAAASHTHVMADITGLQTALDGKAATSHTHVMADITDLAAALAGKAAASHTHAAGDIVSGTIATARLGAGTGGLSNFLRGDSNWTNTLYNSFSLMQPTTGAASSRSIQIGAPQSGVATESDWHTYIDFYAANTTDPTNYQMRLIRWSGANGATDLQHRGTGDLNFTALGVARILFRSSNVARLYYTPSVDLWTAASPFANGFAISGAAGTARRIQYRTGANTRFDVGLDGTLENVADSGSNFVFNYLSDAGVSATSATIFRNTGAWQFFQSPVIPTATAGDNSTKAASTAFVTTAIAGKADKNNASFSGTFSIANPAAQTVLELSGTGVSNYSGFLLWTGTYGAYYGVFHRADGTFQIERYNGTTYVNVLDITTAGVLRSNGTAVSLAGHTHAAADITSGVFNTARLGTGTANSSTYLRGDGTWAAVSAGASNSDGLTEGTTNLFFTETRVRNTLLTGYSVGSNTALATTDSILTAMGKIQAQLNNKQASGSYESAISSGTSTQYWRGDKTWQTLNTSAVAESGNLYYTDARVRAATLSGYAVGSNVALATTDTIIGAFGKIQGMISATNSALSNYVLLSSVSVAAGSNTVVQRNATGYIYANYFNMTADVSTTTPSHVAIQNSSDNFIRWQSWATFCSGVHNQIGANYATAGHTHSTLPGLTFTGDVTLNGTIHNSNWYRCFGQTGIYFSDYAGGFYMTDTSWVRAYNGKGVSAADFAVTSDEKFKTSIEDLVFRGRVRPRSFTWIKDGKLDIGFIAQEVEKLYPELVGTVGGGKDEESYKVVSYERITAVLAIQVNNVEDSVFELRREVDVVREELENVKARLTELESA